MFQPAGEIEIEEEIDSDDELKVPLLPLKRNNKKMYRNGRRALI